MNEWAYEGVKAIALFGIATGAFFFVTTRVSIAMSDRFSFGSAMSRHIYWIYRLPLLVWLTDRRFIVSAVLLFQYDRLVDAVLDSFQRVSFRRGGILQVACVSGDITEKLVSRYSRSAHIAIFDMVDAGIRNSRKKLARAGLLSGAGFFQGDAVSIPVASGSFDCVVSFFLFHELPMEKKRQAFRECLRIIRPGGVFTYAEFHRPKSVALRLLGRTIFGIFEPYAKEMWRWTPDPDPERFETKHRLFLRGYFQVVSIRKRLE